MNQFQGQAISWAVSNGFIELALHRETCNEIGLLTLGELEKFTAALGDLAQTAHALILHSTMKPGFCAGADLRELYHGMHHIPPKEAIAGVRDFLERIHRVMNTIDAAPLTTIAAVHGVTF